MFNPVILAHGDKCCMVYTHLPVHKNSVQSTALDANVAGVPGLLADRCNRPAVAMLQKKLDFQNPVAKKDHWNLL